MNRIRGKWALVTGASSGIGAACARRLAAEGVSVALWARREERLEALAEEARGAGVEARVAAVDVRDREAVGAAVEALAAGGVEPDILINNAGLAAGLDPIQSGDPDDWDRMIDTNVKGLLNVTRAVLQGMIRRDSGHVVNIGSTAGRWVYPSGNVYNATKFAVKALNEGMSLDTASSSIRISSVNPGFVDTEFSSVRFHGDDDRAAAVYEGFTPLGADDVADVVAYVLNAPPHVNLFETVLLPTAQRNGVTVRREDA